MLDTRDAAKARRFLKPLAARAGAHTATYRGISYQATASGIAFGIVARLVVIGTEPALHAVIDTDAGGPSLPGAGLRQAAGRGPVRRARARVREPGRARRRAGPHGALAPSSMLALLAGGGP